MDKKVSILGGGVAGLAAGCFLARNGFAVKLFEANSKVGGCCATTTIDGYTFHDGAVYLALVNVLDHGFAKLGLDRRELLPLRKITANFSATLPDGAVVSLGEGLDLRVEGSAVDANRLRNELHSLVQKWEPVLRLISEEIVIHPFSPWRILWKGWRQLHKIRGTVADEISRLVTHDAAQAALSGSLLYAGVPPEAMPVVSVVGLAAMMTEGFYLPEGGMGRIPQILHQTLHKYGGEVFLNSKVERIIVTGGRVRGVRVKGQGDVEADYVISTANPMATASSLIDADQVPSHVQRKLRRARLSHRAVSLQFGLSNTIKPRGHLNMVLPPLKRQREIFQQDPLEVTWPTYFVPTLTMPELAPTGGSIVEMFHPVGAEIAVEDWDDKKKDQLTQSAIQSLARMHPIDVVVARIRSPRDFMHTLHLYQGALYGLSPATDPRDLFAHDFPINGLFMAGQCTYPGYGVAPSIMSGIFAAEALLDRA